MIDENQLQTAVEIFGPARVLTQIIPALDSVGELLSRLEEAGHLAACDLETMHANLNTVTLLGGKELASQLANLETTLRANDKVGEDTLGAIAETSQRSRLDFERILKSSRPN